MIVVKLAVGREDAEEEEGEQKEEDKKEITYSPVRVINIDKQIIDQQVAHCKDSIYMINVIQELFSIIVIDKPKMSVDKGSENIFLTHITAQRGLAAGGRSPGSMQ